MSRAKQLPYRDFIALPDAAMRAHAESFNATMGRRRSVRQFDSKMVDRAIIDTCLQAAHSAPSGANMQPWHFVVVTDPVVKAEIRVQAEKEEREFYSGRAGREWTKAVEPMGTGPVKPFLESAPYLIVVFQKNYAVSSNHQRINHYYVPESVGIAVGILVSGLHQAGVATLIHTPRPMGFLRKILKRPVNERACMIVVAGYPAADATVPVLKKKPFSQVVTYV